MRPRRCRSAGRSPPRAWPSDWRPGRSSRCWRWPAALTSRWSSWRPPARRWAAAGWWFAAGACGRRLLVPAQPVAPATRCPRSSISGPISLPHPERLQSGRPDFSIAHYATDTGVWRDYFGPGLHQAFGALWPLVVAGALLGGLLALAAGRDRDRALDRRASPCSGCSPTCSPRSAPPAPRARRSPSRSTSASSSRRCWSGWRCCRCRGLFDERRGASGPCSRPARRSCPHRPLRRRRCATPARVFGVPGRRSCVAIPAALLSARGAGRSTAAVGAGFAALALALFAIGYPIQRDYLRRPLPQRGRRRRAFPAWTSTPPIAGRAGRGRAHRPRRHHGRLRQYGFYGTDLSNRVVALGARARTAPSTRSPTAAPSAPPSTTRTSTTWSPRPSSTSSTPTTRSPRPRRAGCGASGRSRRSAAAAPVTIWRVRGRPRPLRLRPGQRAAARIPERADRLTWAR